MKLTVTVTLQVLYKGLGENEVIVGEDATLKIKPGATAVALEPPLLKFKRRTLLPTVLEIGTINETDCVDKIMHTLASTVPTVIKQE
jgi:hypothetical protein